MGDGERNDANARPCGIPTIVAVPGGLWVSREFNGAKLGIEGGPAQSATFRLPRLGGMGIARCGQLELVRRSTGWAEARPLVATWESGRSNGVLCPQRRALRTRLRD